MKKIRVIVVDDSALIRGVFKEILESDSAIEVIAVAHDPIDAREKIKKLNPDVITLDIEMPKMDGLSFLEKIMSLRPMPVVMVSSLTQKGASQTLKALELGAVDYVTKTGSGSFDIDRLGDDLIGKVKAAARAKIMFRPKKNLEKKPKIVDSCNYKKYSLVVIGSSTGGVEALREVFTHMPKDIPPILVTQHMPSAFTGTFAKRLNSLCEPEVKEAKNGEIIEGGKIYIAPGNLHLTVKKAGGVYKCRVEDGELVSGHKPSVDMLFESVAEIGKNTVGVILTGMGKDGAGGLLKMKKAGAKTLGQDENSSLVYGMPKAAYMAGAVDRQVSLKEMAKEILKTCT